MSETSSPPDRDASAPAGKDATLSPLPGEYGAPRLAAQRRLPLSGKALLAVGLLAVSLVAVSVAWLQRLAASGRKAQPNDSRLLRDKPMAASAEPRRLELPTVAWASSAASTSASASAPVRVPALIPSAEDLDPAGVSPPSVALLPRTPSAAPEDAPVLVVSGHAVAEAPAGPPGGFGTTDRLSSGEHADPLAATARNLQSYQRQLHGVLDGLVKASDVAGDGSVPASPGVGLAVGPAAAAPAMAPAGLFGGQLQASATPRVQATQLGERSLILPKGTAFTCALKTRVISATSGLVGCQVQRNVYGDDGRVLLIERGSHLDGEYRIASVRPGMVRIPVLWTRLRTPLGVTVDLASPATGGLGESGIDGHVDNRWPERIGAAMLLSLIDDAVKLSIQNQGNDRQGDTIVLPSTTGNASKLAEKVLDSTINIPPLIYRNQGGIVGIYVARDIDFSSVYELLPTASAAEQP